ncbi:hypothetical protein V1504DRAFT_434330 [Lipomyces starkeyi]
MDLSFIEKKAYKNALDFLIANESEQRLDTRLPFSCFLALQEEARKRYGEESGYPRVEYSSKDSTVTIITCLFLNETRNALNGESSESVKKPDGGLKYYRDFRTVTIAAIEVGVSEKYEKLIADVTLWMEEFHCRTGILFSLNETPRFSYPRRQDMNEFSVANDLNPFHDAIVEVGRNQPLGPYHYRGHNWFGSLDSAFIEIFRRDPLTGILNQSPRIRVVENGHMVLQGDNVDVGLTIEDLLPFGQENIEGIQQVSIGCKANLLQQYLEAGAVDTAEFRFFGMRFRREDKKKCLACRAECTDWSYTGHVPSVVTDYC